MNSALFFPWIAEFLLEAVIAYLAFRSRLTSLCSILTFGCAADLAGGIIRAHYGSTALAWLFWIQLPIQCILLCWLGCEICAKLVAERRRGEIFRAAVMISITGGMLAAWAWSEGHTLGDKLLDAELAADSILFIAIGVAWVSRILHLRAPWNWLAAGFMVKVGSDIICTLLFEHWPGAQYLYSIGEIGALLLWGIGAAGKVKLEEFRKDLGRIFVEEDIRHLEKVKV